MSARTLVNALLAASSALLVASCWQRDALPPPERLDPSLFAEPAQAPTAKDPFRARVGGIDYTVRPLYAYDLAGLVVSKHDADTWWDWIHRAWQDNLNVTDLCVVWGANARSGSYRRLDFSSGQFVCNVETRDAAAWAAFDMTALSNNHLLADDPAVARTLKQARVGDQVRFRGYLAEYSHDHGFRFFRGTSTTRTDTGNGACETVYATDAEILHAGNRAWRIGVWVSVVGLLAGVAAWVALPFRAED
jgi:hypothetical protein